jgi:hypothetical protein
MWTIVNLFKKNKRHVVVALIMDICEEFKSDCVIVLLGEEVVEPYSIQLMENSVKILVLCEVMNIKTMFSSESITLNLLRLVKVFGVLKFVIGSRWW